MRLFAAAMTVLVLASPGATAAASLQDEVQITLDDLVSCVAKEATRRTLIKDTMVLIKKFCEPEADQFFKTCDAYALTRPDGKSICPLLYATQMSQIEENLKSR